MLSVILGQKRIKIKKVITLIKLRAEKDVLSRKRLLSLKRLKTGPNKHKLQCPPPSVRKYT